MKTENALIEAALQARKNAYVPYSKFQVGAAVRAGSGRVYKGCNIENASFGLTNCAERTAIFKAISEGETTLLEIAIAADTEDPTAPCGACRQVIAEFLPADGKVTLGNLKNSTYETTVSELLPGAFQAEDFIK